MANKDNLKRGAYEGWRFVKSNRPNPLEKYAVKVKIRDIKDGKIRIPHPDELC